MVKVMFESLKGLFGNKTKKTSNAEAVTIYKNGDYKTAYRIWKEQADSGNTVAKFNLSIMYKKGEGVTRNLERSFKWCKEAAEEGDADAQFILSSKYEYGVGVTRNLERSFKWCKEAADQGHAEALKNFLRLRGQQYAPAEKILEKEDVSEEDGDYEEKKGVKERPKKVTKTVKKSSKKVTKVVKRGPVVETIKKLKNKIDEAISLFNDQEYKMAFLLFEKLAGSGNSEAQYYIGRMYEYGLGTTKDYKKMFMYYQKSANQADPKGQWALGSILSEGKGVSRDYAKAFNLFKYSAIQGYVDGQYYLGKMYQALKNDERATYWYNKVKDQEYDAGQSAINSLLEERREEESEEEEKKEKAYERRLKQIEEDYEEEEEEEEEASEVEQRKLINKNDDAISAYKAGDYKTAHDIWGQLARAGDPNAQYQLAVTFYNGQGVTKDYTESITWLEKAVKREHVNACKLLAKIFLEYKKVKLDFKEAFKRARKLYAIAASKGDVEAQSCLACDYEDGRGGTMNFEKALFWHKRAAKQGSKESIQRIKIMVLEKKYENGKITSPELLALAEEHESQGNFSQVTMIGKQLQKEDPNNKTVRLLLQRVKNK